MPTNAGLGMNSLTQQDEISDFSSFQEHFFKETSLHLICNTKMTDGFLTQPDRRGSDRTTLGRRRRNRVYVENFVIKSAKITVPKLNSSRICEIMKRAIDVFGAFFGLVLLSPLLAMVALLIKIDGGPILFGQTRLGIQGRHFTMWKLRSMVVDAEALKDNLIHQNESNGPTFKMKNDPRITRIGRIIRKLSIDELPQLWNVLIGEMTLVGPRPALPKEVAQYRLWHTQRLAVKPGITCIWQTSGRSQVGFQEWMRMDIRYLENKNIKKDLTLLAKTVITVIKGNGAY